MTDSLPSPHPQAVLRYNPCGNGRTDIGTHNNTNCLNQCHQSRINKTNNHNRCCTAALNNRCDNGTYDDCQQPVTCKIAQ